jgi:hypothetical protein
MDPVARACAATFQYLAEWFGSEGQMAELGKLARDVAALTQENDMCCPVCQEVTCDEGCPLEPVRSRWQKAAAPPPEPSVALWYWRRLGMYYSLFDDEDTAARVGNAMEDDDGAAVAGVQFPDGRLVEREAWEALAAASRRAEEAYEAQREAEKSRPQRPKRKIRAPFDGGYIRVEAGEPAWLGLPGEGARADG